MTLDDRFNMANIDSDKVAALLRACAATIIMPYHGKLQDGHIQFKNGDKSNMVTVADHAAEKFLTDALKTLLPGSEVVGEEAVESDPAILGLLEDPQKTVWVIDPIDGTGNFVRGSDTFCIIVALVSQGKTRMGWIYDPVQDSLLFAQRGQGVTIDGKKTVLPAPASPGEAASSPLPAVGYNGFSGINPVPGIGLSSLRCSGLEYFRMVKGEALFSLYRIMKPWDHLAGTLAVAEAGGVVRKWDRSDYAPGDRAGGLISAARQDVWEQARQSIPHSTLKKNGIEP